jgi:hypothetical protein
MSRIVPAGSLTWTQSTSPDVAGYFVYYQEDTEPTYASTSVNVGLATTIDLPLEGQSPVEGDFFYGISAYDLEGNESDIVPIQVSLDTTPPGPPRDVVYNP